MAYRSASWLDRQPMAEREAAVHAARLASLAMTVDDGGQIADMYVDLVADDPNGGVALVPALLLRRLLEAVAGVHQLVHGELAGPACALNRTAREAYLGIEHSVAESFEERCMAYVVWRHKRTLRNLAGLQRMWASGAAGGKFALLRSIDSPTDERVVRAAADAERRLADPRRARAVEANEALASRRRKEPQTCDICGHHPAGPFTMTGAFLSQEVWQRSSRTVARDQVPGRIAASAR